MIYLSIVIPVKDEEESLPILHQQLSSLLKSTKKSYEIIFIDDGSEDSSYRILQGFQKKDTHVKLLKFRANFGKSTALAAGFQVAQGKIFITIDADLQDDIKEIPKLLKKIEDGYDLVSGWRLKRADHITKRISSFLFNRGTMFLTGIKLHDLNCGLKIFTKEVARELHLYGELHRFIPILASKKKFRVTEVVVNHYPRRYGKSKFGFERGWRGIVDLLTTIFLTDYSIKPAHFFGKIGLIFFFIGFSMDAYVAIVKITTGTTQGKIPMLLAGILCIILGVQLLSTGLIAEMIAYHFMKSEKNPSVN